MDFFFNLHEKVQNRIGDAFERFGKLIANNSWKIVIIVGIIDVLLGIGLLKLETKSDIYQYVPTGSKASKDQERIKQIFTVNTSVNFYEQSVPDTGKYGLIIVELKTRNNILDYSYWKDLTKLKIYVEATSVNDSNGEVYFYQDLCARTKNKCAVDGDFIFSEKFINDMNSSNISFPKYHSPNGHTIFIDRYIGGAESSGGILTSASAIKLKFNLQEEQPEKSSRWEEAFFEKMASFSSSTLSVKYVHSDSLSVELSKNVSKDITFFSITFTFMITFSCLALMNCKCIDNRVFLGFAGVLSTGLAIVASIGFVSLCGGTFVDIVGITPFLILGIGVDDMFIMMAGLKHAKPVEDIPMRIGKTMKISGMAITLTSITDIIAFCAGAASVFPSVRNFSWYTGCAILFSYLNYVTFYTAIMTINEVRVSKKLHFVFCCTEHDEDNRELESFIEKYPKRLFKKLLRYTPLKVFFIILFLGFFAVTTWGATQFREDLDLRDLVSPDSYYYSAYDTDQRLFSQSQYVSINIGSPIDYRLNSTLSDHNSVLKTVQADDDIQSDFYLSWYTAYIESKFFDNTTLHNFVTGLYSFLQDSSGNVFINDITIKNTQIVASRVHVISKNITISSSKAAMMIRLREKVKSSALPVFVFSPQFIFNEQYAQIFPQTMQTLGVSVAAVFIVTFIFIPLPIIIILVTVSVAMIMVGVVGCMYFWELTLSSVTMIHIIMCIGFSIDFSTHICHAFVNAEKPGCTSENKQERVKRAIDLAGGPILNAGLSSLVGVIMLAFSKSYIFFSFFKVMFVVIVFGTLQALIFIPIVLSLFGPVYKKRSDRYAENNIEMEKK